MKLWALFLSLLAPEGIQLPSDYREWVFLSSGSGMTYGPAAASAREGAPLFDNVFVNPESYRAFLKTGKWPGNTTFILEIRRSESHGSINQSGHFQSGVMAIEAEAKDANGEWKFYDIRDGAAKLIPTTATCYSCHAKNTAVENTFVQFYPSLMEVAEHMGTVKKNYVR